MLAFINNKPCAWMVYFANKDEEIKYETKKREQDSVLICVVRTKRMGDNKQDMSTMRSQQSQRIA